MTSEDHTAHTGQSAIETEQEIRDSLVVKKIVCKNCGKQPVAGWKGGKIHLVCDCGTRELPEDIVPNHEWMPEDVRWTVVEDA